MKKLSTLLVASVLSAASFAQTCTPDALFIAIGLPGIYPLPTSPLPDGTATLSYQNGAGVTLSLLTSNQSLDPATFAAFFPNFPVTIPPGVIGITINQMSVVSIDGLPAGMSYVCLHPGCESVPASQNCIKISGTPTTPGDYTVKLNTHLAGIFEGTVPVIGTPYSQSFNTQSLPTSPTAPISYDMKIKNDASVAEFTAAGLNLYPNPASDLFVIAYPATHADMAAIEITDMAGKTVYATSKSIQSEGGFTSVETNGLPNGLYRVTFSAGSVHTASKLVVSK